MIRPVFFALCLSLSAGATHAFNLNDCVINGVKGVSSDVAARMVRTACDQKQIESKRQRLEQRTKDYGELLDNTTFEADKYFMEAGPGFHSIRYTNKNKERTVTYVQLGVSPGPSGTDFLCDYSKGRDFSYKVTVKPNESVSLIYPTTTSTNCIGLNVVLGRVPSWKDAFFSSSVKPADKDPLEAYK